MRGVADQTQSAVDELLGQIFCKRRPENDLMFYRRSNDLARGAMLALCGNCKEFSAQIFID